MSPYHTLLQAVGEYHARKAMHALQTEAERRREGRAPVRIHIVFEPGGAARQAEWGTSLDPSVQSRFFDIHPHTPNTMVPEKKTFWQQLWIVVTITALVTAALILTVMYLAS